MLSANGATNFMAMTAKEAWEKFSETRARDVKADRHLIEAFFTGYKEGMSYGMEEGRILCVKLMNASSPAPADENSNS